MPDIGPLSPTRQLRKSGGGSGPRNGVRPSGSVPRVFQPSGRLGKQVSAAGLQINVRGLQYFLRNKGYDVAVDGKLGPITRAALRDAVDKGFMKNPTLAEQHLISGMHGQVLGPKAFDSMISHAGQAPFKPLTGKGGVLDSKGNSIGTKMGGLTAKQATASGNPSVNPGPTMNALKGASGQDIPTNDANFGQLFNVDPTATAMAQEQFQPQINDQQLLVNRDPVQAAQNEKDVADWYNQVLGSQSKAASADTAANKSAVDATNQQAQELVQSLGGSANQGAGEAAAAGQNASGTIAAIGQAQQGLDSELAPILAAQAAQQKTNQANLDTAKLQADQQTLQNLQGQEGNAETAAQMQLQSANNSLDQARQQALEQILQYNNSLKQQKFQNQLGLLTTQTAAAMNGVNMAKDAAETNYYNARAAHEGGSAMSASQVNDVQRQLMAALGSKGLIVSPSTGVYKLAPGVTPQQALSFSRNFVSSYGAVPGNFVPNTLNAIQGY